MSQKHGSPWLEREDFGNVTVARLKMPKHIDEEVVRIVFDPLYGLVSETGRNQLVLNLAAVVQLPSLVLGKLVMLNRRVQVVNGRLALCCLTPAVRQSLETTRLLDLFRIHESEDEALQTFASADQAE